MTRDKAYQILTENIKNPNLIKHHLAAETVMRALARKFSADEEEWGIVGLLHDADYEETKDQPEKHTVILEEKIGDKVKPEIMTAIRSHAYGHSSSSPEPKTPMEWSMYACDELTGFIIAVALVKPDKKLSSVDVESVLKRMKEPAFARSVDREQIKVCEEKLGISLKEFISVALSSMQSISSQLEL